MNVGLQVCLYYWIYIYVYLLVSSSVCFSCFCLSSSLSVSLSLSLKGCTNRWCIEACRQDVQPETVRQLIDIKDYLRTHFSLDLSIFSEVDPQLRTLCARRGVAAFSTSSRKTYTICISVYFCMYEWMCVCLSPFSPCVCLFVFVSVCLRIKLCLCV